MNYADTNWLTAMFFDLSGTPVAERNAIVRRFLRSEGGILGISPVAWLEARNVFARTAGESNPPEWRELSAGLGGRFYLDPMSWDLMRREVWALVDKWAWKQTLGTFDLAIVASLRLAGATRLLSFDEGLKALVVADGLEVFPPLTDQGLAKLAKLRA